MRIFMERLNSSNKVAGVKQTKAAVNSGSASVVYVASDADITLTEPITAVTTAWVCMLKLWKTDR